MIKGIGINIYSSLHQPIPQLQLMSIQSSLYTLLLDTGTGGGCLTSRAPATPSRPCPSLHLRSLVGMTESGGGIGSGIGRLGTGASRQRIVDFSHRAPINHIYQAYLPKVGKHLPMHFRDKFVCGVLYALLLPCLTHGLVNNRCVGLSYVEFLKGPLSSVGRKVFRCIAKF